MKNDYGIIDPKAVENALMIEKFNDYVIQTISKGETEFYIYGTDDKRLCQTLLYLKKDFGFNRRFGDYNFVFQEDEYGEIDYIYVSW